MDPNEQNMREMTKAILKMIAINNPSLNEQQKRVAIRNIDQAAHKADWFVEILRSCGYIT